MKGKVLFVYDTLGYGGAEKQLVFAAEGLVRRGWQVSILNLNQDKSTGKSRTVDPRIQIFIADIPYRNVFQSNYELIKFTSKITRQFKPDVIIGFNELCGFCVSVAGRLCGVPSIISERGDPFVTYNNAKLPRKIKLWCINKADGAVFQTQQASEFYCQRLRNNSIVIPNPVFVNEQLPSLDYVNLPKTVISLGRLDNHQKRFDVMLKSFAKFHNTHSDYELKIYGGGEDEGVILQWIKELELESCVKIMGVSSKPIQDYCKGGIFLITSDYEGISNSLLEAMACGLPVVATDHTPGGARLLIRHQENGLLVPIRDVDAISNALSLYADSVSLREKCGNNAKRVLIDYSPVRTLDLWENYISKLIENKH